jgi:hypothetical protein
MSNAISNSNATLRGPISNPNHPGSSKFLPNFPELPARNRVQNPLVFANFPDLPRTSRPNASETTPFSNSIARLRLPAAGANGDE